MMIETFRALCPCGHPVAVRGRSGARYAYTCPACGRAWTIVPAVAHVLGSTVSVIGFGRASRRPIADAYTIER